MNIPTERDLRTHGQDSNRLEVDLECVVKRVTVTALAKFELEGYLKKALKAMLDSESVTTESRCAGQTCTGG